MKHLREYIKKILLEDAAAFHKELKAKNLGEPPEWNYKGSYNSSTLAKQKSWGQAVKDLFRKYADHDFFKTLSLVHWVSYPQHLQNLKNKNKDEISCTMTLPNDKEFNHTPMAEFGLLVKGHVTLATNFQDDIFSGYKSDYHPPKTRSGEIKQFMSPSDRERWSEKDIKAYKHRSASSGINKYPKEFEFFGDAGGGASFPYILSREDFNKDYSDTNEALVDNWTALAIIIVDEDIMDVDDVLEEAELFNIPIIALDGYTMWSP